eukprot:13299587-Alexandrium_andersonii.AAC.1
MPPALPHTAHALNARIVDGDSAWKRRNGEHWQRRSIPFGSWVCFMRSLTYTKEVPKFGAKATPGVFLGYKLQPGAK